MRSEAGTLPTLFPTPKMYRINVRSFLLSCFSAISCEMLYLFSAWCSGFKIKGLGFGRLYSRGVAEIR